MPDPLPPPLPSHLPDGVTPIQPQKAREAIPPNPPDGSNVPPRDDREAKVQQATEGILNTENNNFIKKAPLQENQQISCDKFKSIKGLKKGLKEVISPYRAYIPDFNSVSLDTAKIEISLAKTLTNNAITHGAVGDEKAAQETLFSSKLGEGEKNSEDLEASLYSALDGYKLSPNEKKTTQRLGIIWVNKNNKLQLTYFSTGAYREAKKTNSGKSGFATIPVSIEVNKDQQAILTYNFRSEFKTVPFKAIPEDQSQASAIENSNFQSFQGHNKTFGLDLVSVPKDENDKQKEQANNLYQQAESDRDRVVGPKNDNEVVGPPEKNDEALGPGS